MTNINETLWNEIKPYLHKYDCFEDEIEHFLFHYRDFLKRQNEAIHIIEGVMTLHGKKDLLQQVSELARVEYGIRELEPWVRDHVVHALLSFILGIHINENFIRYSAVQPVDNFQWELAGMFHDIGYPVEIAKDIMKPFADKINEIKRNLEDTGPDIRFKVVPVGLENLKNNFNSFDIIQERLWSWGLDVDARKAYEESVASANVDHGIISSLSILYLIDMMYQKYNPKREFKNVWTDRGKINFNQRYFEEDVVSACTAIYIHNLPKEYFIHGKIDRRKTPLAFLLKLSDCLQEWERPSKENQTGFLANKFGIEISKTKLIFHADIPDDKKKKIIDDISSCLVASDVEIR